MLSSHLLQYGRFIFNVFAYIKTILHSIYTFIYYIMHETTYEKISTTVIKMDKAGKWIKIQITFEQYYIIILSCIVRHKSFTEIRYPSTSVKCWKPLRLISQTQLPKSIEDKRGKRRHTHTHTRIYIYIHTYNIQWRQRTASANLIS